MSRCFYGQHVNGTIPGEDTPLFEVRQPKLSGYKIITELGHGEMSVVYQAYYENINRMVAIKMFQLKLSADQHLAVRYLRQARVLACLRHENIINIFMADMHDGNPYHVLEYHEKGGLSKHMKEFAVPRRAAELISQVASAMDYAHKRGVIHRNLKPANILLNAKSQAIVSNFRLAIMTNGTMSETQDLTSTLTQPAAPTSLASTQGTPAYMAPEQFSESTLTPKVDIWSMGVILYELLAGQKPFQGIHREELAQEISAGLQDEPHRLAPAIPVKLSRIISKCLMHDPEKRYSTAGELADDLKQVCRRYWWIFGRRANLR